MIVNRVEIVDKVSVFHQLLTNIGVLHQNIYLLIQELINLRIFMGVFMI